MRRSAHVNPRPSQQAADLVNTVNRVFDIVLTIVLFDIVLTIVLRGCDTAILSVAFGCWKVPFYEQKNESLGVLQIVESHNCFALRSLKLVV